MSTINNSNSLLNFNFRCLLWDGQPAPRFCLTYIIDSEHLYQKHINKFQMNAVANSHKFSFF